MEYYWTLLWTLLWTLVFANIIRKTLYNKGFNT